jgi:hypothetical protein
MTNPKRTSMDTTYTKEQIHRTDSMVSWSEVTNDREIISAELAIDLGWFPDNLIDGSLILHINHIYYKYTYLWSE